MVMNVPKNIQILLLSFVTLFFCPQGHAAAFEPVIGNVVTPKLPWVSSTIRLGTIIPKELFVYPPVIEDPDWYLPRPGSGQRKPEYGGRSGLGSSYLEVLEEALNGNPLAMADLVIQTQYGPDYLAAAFPHFPKEMHSKEFWMEWIGKFTSPGWAYTAVARYNEGIGSTSSALGDGAMLGDPKSMYLYTNESSCSEKRQWTIVAANAGYGKAAYVLSRYYRYGDFDTGYEILQDTDKMNYYLDMAKERGDAGAFTDAVHDFYRGINGKTADMEEVYYHALLAYALLETEDGFLLIDRDIPPLPPLESVHIVSCIGHVSTPTRGWTDEEKARRRLTPEERAALVPSPEIVRAATKRAYAWLVQHKALREAELAPERIRRAELTEQLRAFCAPAVAEIEKRKKDRGTLP
jgi:hypothetical protein